MGWASASAIINPQIPIMVNAVRNGELEEAVAHRILSNLIAKLQEGDWDTEDETLRNWTHVPWVVKAFRDNDVTMVADDGLPTRRQIKQAVLKAIESESDSWYDLSENYARETHAEAVTNAVLAFVKVED